MAYSVYSFLSQYTETGQIGVYIGTREENLGPCLEIVAEQVADIAAGNFTRREIQRAKDNIKGRIVLSMESTSNRMSRLGKSLITDTELLTVEQIVAEIDAVEPDEVAELAALLLAPEKLAAAGSGRARSGSSEAVERVHPGLAGPRPRRERSAVFGAARARSAPSCAAGARRRAGHEVGGIGRGDRIARRGLRRRRRLHAARRGRQTDVVRMCRSRRSRVDRHDGLRPREPSTSSRRDAACRSSTRRTSRSGRS